MSDPDTSASSPRPPASPVGAPLPKGGRLIAGLLAVVAGVAGGVSVFVKDAGEAPGTALITLAALFGYICVSGQQVLSIKIGNNEMRLAQAAEAASAVVDAVMRDPAVPLESKARVAEVVGATGAQLPNGQDLAHQARQFVDLERFQYEWDVYRAVQRLLAGPDMESEGIQVLAETPPRGLRSDSLPVFLLRARDRNMAVYAARGGRLVSPDPPVRGVLVLDSLQGPINMDAYRGFAPTRRDMRPGWLGSEVGVVRFGDSG